MIDVPETHDQRERGRVVAQGHSTEDGSRCTLVVIHEADGSWTIHGLGVRLSTAAMITLAESILGCAR